MGPDSASRSESHNGTADGGTPFTHFKSKTKSLITDLQYKLEHYPTITSLDCLNGSQCVTTQIKVIKICLIWKKTKRRFGCSLFEHTVFRNLKEMFMPCQVSNNYYDKNNNKRVKQRQLTVTGLFSLLIHSVLVFKFWLI